MPKYSIREKGKGLTGHDLERQVNLYADRAKTHLVDGPCIIDAEAIVKSFGKKEVLKEASIEIAEGETRVIIGRSGCGKSVFLKHIIRLLEPDSGVMKVMGEDIGELRLQALYEMRMNFGMVFQGAALFDSLTVRENVGFVMYEYSDIPRSEIDDRVTEALHQVGLKDVEELGPAELSGGMKKRVGIARAIVTKPAIVLYDEPTTGLDPITADVINDLIMYFASELDVTSVVVTHDMVSAYKICDEISMMFGGKIIETGTPDEIKSTDNPFVQQFIEGESAGPIDVIEGN